jgi:hypothetical protein
VARFLPALVVVALLGGSAAAFSVAERLKLERSPIIDTKVDKEVSPTAGTPAEIAFRLRKADRLTLAIVDGDGDVVRELVRSREVRKGAHTFRWRGRDDSGTPVPDGSYKPRVHLADEGRTILLPNPIRVDAEAPSISLAGLNRRVFSPDGDYRFDYLKVRYRLSEPARAILLANGRLVVKSKFFNRRVLTWTGRAAGLPRRPGRYRMQLRAVDRAGNMSVPTPVFVVRIRYIALARHVIRAPAGGRIVVRVATDAHTYTWRIGSRRGRVTKRRLSLAAGPPGRYRLVVSERGHRAHAVVLVHR